jgi:hypothetical protein
MRSHSEHLRHGILATVPSATSDSNAREMMRSVSDGSNAKKGRDFENRRSASTA